MDVDHCMSFPCLNDALCVDTMSGYVCTCAPGWTGIQCENGMI